MTEAAPRPEIRRGMVKDWVLVSNQAVAYVKDYPADAIEKGLPRTRFGDWIESLLSKDLLWEMNDCGEPSAPGTTGPACVEMRRGPLMHPDILIFMNIGDADHGIIEPPHLFYAKFKTNHGEILAKHLTEIPEILKSNTRK